MIIIHKRNKHVNEQNYAYYIFGSRQKMGFMNEPSFNILDTCTYIAFTLTKMSYSNIFM